MDIPYCSDPLGSGPTGPGSGYSAMSFSLADILFLLLLLPITNMSRYLIVPPTFFLLSCYLIMIS